VVQIVGTSSEASRKMSSKKWAASTVTSRKCLTASRLYVVTYGSFPSRAAATAAIKNLPAKIQAGKPWPRTVASVQQELATAR
jgi:DamX protein